MAGCRSGCCNCQGITPILQGVIPVAGNPSPTDVVLRCHTIQLTPQILVLDQFPI
jgi:hypothetical protein